MKQTSKESQEQKKELGGEHQNKDQYDGIPETFADSHLEPCYKKFKFVLAGKTSHQHPIEQRRSSLRTAGETSTAWTYPNVCNICKKGQMNQNGNQVSPAVLTSFQDQETIKVAAKVNDKEM